MATISAILKTSLWSLFHHLYQETSWCCFCLQQIQSMSLLSRCVIHPGPAASIFKLLSQCVIKPGPDKPMIKVWAKICHWGTMTLGILDVQLLDTGLDIRNGLCTFSPCGESNQGLWYEDWPRYPQGYPTATTTSWRWSEFMYMILILW